MMEVMTAAPPPTGGSDPIDALVARVIDECGTVVTIELDPWKVDELVQRLIGTMYTKFDDEFNEVAVRMVLGSACTTAARAIEQFVAALQLPYGAARGWADFTDALSDRPAGLRECVVVVDAAQLLKHEVYDLWQSLVDDLHHDHRSGCLGRGWSTLVLVDNEIEWQEWVFKSARRARGRPSPRP
jgi:hypothetical protein